MTAPPSDRASLAFGVPPAPAGTIHVRAIGSDFTLRPREGREILFGRNRKEVHVCIGEDDGRVSRLQGVLTHRRDQWWVTNTGRLPLRLPGSMLLFNEEEPVPLGEGYTPLFVRGSSSREHLLELFVTGPDGGRPPTRSDDPTRPPKRWPLKPEERLALIVLGQRYLLHEACPQPLAWKQAALQLQALQPDAGWGERRLQNVVAGVRERLSRGGVFGVVEGDLPQPIGNALNDNLLTELLLSTTLVPTDLAVLDGAFGR
ncbi:FHA domain-containing protein [Streptomyces litchfieldiae]|uniref:FHA domain-containing protein n=1 Tax=Streptomyces litchfieldiae TaxID=3075543 RepID=A0ABU2MKT2_9ACTN|nr:FHA domain-containing protein [Streptomyces sp. DSM 44938]MDT0342130.1 FHA domain-containing protein [Streptomyces sp. DSM 44938]